jgi:uncharacterized protein (DUF4415 family)
MRNLETRQAAARAEAREQLAAMTEEEDRAITEAALADPSAQPLDQARLARMRPISAPDAADLGRGVRGRGRPPLDAPKRLVSLRLDPAVIDGFRATGPGWQSRINAVLREHLPDGAG